MKKILTLTVAILTISFYSCKKEEDNKHIGTWYFSSGNIVEYGDNINNNYPFPVDECEEKEKITFSKSTYTSYSYEKQSDGSCLENIVEVPYKYDGKTLSFSINGVTYNYEMFAGEVIGLVIKSDYGPNKKLEKFYRRQ